MVRARQAQPLNYEAMSLEWTCRWCCLWDQPNLLPLTDTPLSLKININSSTRTCNVKTNKPKQHTDSDEGSNQTIFLSLPSLPLRNGPNRCIPRLFRNFSLSEGFPPFSLSLSLSSLLDSSIFTHFVVTGLILRWLTPRAFHFQSSVVVDLLHSCPKKLFEFHSKLLTTIQFHSQ